MRYDYLVVGAGLYGAVYAHEKAKQGRSVLVIDRRRHIAGNIYTEKVGGIDVHRYGAHIFHTSDREVWDYVNQFAEFNNYINSPIARYKDELYNLPFNMNTFSRMWGIRTPDEAKAVIEKQRSEAREEIAGGRRDYEPQNLEEQALLLAGRDIYEKLVKGYTEKQWGRPCTELPAFIIRRLPFRFVYDNNYFNDRYQGIPVGGYTALVSKLLAGIPVRLGVDFRRDVRDLSEDEYGGCEEYRPKIGGPAYALGEDTFDRLIYTGMIDEFFGYCCGPLEYRSLRFETEVLPDVDNYQGNAVVNYTDRDVPYTRIIEHKFFEFGKDENGGPIRGTVITREYPAVFERGGEPYYPVNDEKNNALYEKYKALAESRKAVSFGGRLGLYKYFDMDKIVRRALDDAREN